MTRGGEERSDGALADAVYKLRRAEKALYDVGMREREPNANRVHPEDVAKREKKYLKARARLDALLPSQDGNQ